MTSVYVGVDLNCADNSAVLVSKFSPQELRAGVPTT